MITDREDIEVSESAETLSELLQEIHNAENTLECALLSMQSATPWQTDPVLQEFALTTLTMQHGVYIDALSLQANSKSAGAEYDDTAKGIASSVAGAVTKVGFTAIKTIIQASAQGMQELTEFYRGYIHTFNMLDGRVKETRAYADDLTDEPKGDKFKLGSEALLLSSDGVVAKSADDVLALLERVTEAADYVLNTWTKEVHDLGKAYAGIIRSYKPNDEELAIKITERLIAATDKLKVDRLINGIKAVKQTDGKYGNVPTYRSASMMSNLSLYVLWPAKALPTRETVARVAAAHRGLDIKLGKHTKFKLGLVRGDMSVYTQDDIIRLTDACAKLMGVVDEYLSSGRADAMVGIGGHLVKSLQRDMKIIERNIEIEDSRYVATIYRFATTYQRLATTPMTFFLPQIKALISGVLTTCQRSRHVWLKGQIDKNK